MNEIEAKFHAIAIIDDDEPVRVATSSLVRSLGFQAVAFSSAEEYLRSARRRSFSLLISDVQMPGMSGLDLQDRLVAESDRVPIIFITAFPHENVEKRARAAGAVCVLNKPFDHQTLVECIRHALKGTLSS